MRSMPMSIGHRAPVATSLALLFSASLVTLAGACSDPAEESPAQTALDSAIVAWTDQGFANYTFTSSRSCECLPEWAAPMILEVQDNVIVNATYEASGDPVPSEIAASMHTIDGLFGVIQDGIDRNAATIQVTYDPVIGIPVDIFIDYDEGVADEEFAAMVRDFSPQP